MKKLLLLAALAVFMGCEADPTQADTGTPTSVDVGGVTLTLPLTKMSATQLYCFNDHRGYTGVQTVLAGIGAKDSSGDRQFELGFGAADNLGSDKKMPFLSFQAHLPQSYFGSSANALYFGVAGWERKNSKGRNETVGFLDGNFLFR